MRKKGMGSLSHYLFMSLHFSQGYEHHLASRREHVSSGPATNLASLQVAFVSCFNLTNSIQGIQCTGMTTKRGVPTCTRQATKAGALGEKDVIPCPPPCPLIRKYSEAWNRLFCPTSSTNKGRRLMGEGNIPPRLHSDNPELPSLSCPSLQALC